MGQNSKKRILYSILFLVSFSLGAVAGWMYFKHKELAQPTLVREMSPQYKFINPILFLQVPEDESTPQFQTLKNTVSAYINNAINKNLASDVSVYFRELNTNRWVGVNADDTYAPGSLLKVASMIAFFRAAEDNPDMLAKEIYLSPDSVNGDKNQDFYPPINKTKIGNTYTTEDLLSYAIVDSDNIAAGALDILTGNEILNKTDIDMRIPINNGKLKDDFMTTKMISRLFRSLYNGTYISAQLSEKALDLLSKTTFTEGLVKGVPPGITIAHKFGERTLEETNSLTPDSQIHELHDCGIVYAPADPYFVCVMTKGGDFTNLQKIISDISAMAWEKIEELKK